MFSRESWQLLCLSRFSNVHSSHSYPRNFHLQALIASCRITILNTPQELLRPSTPSLASIGGVLLLNPGPDLNPIENLWHELKEYIRREAKPTTKQELVDGINTFWTTVDENKCHHYINHLKKVIPRVIEKQGDATGY